MTQVGLDELPTGNITMLFSDIEGSTQMVRQLGDDWGPVLAQQRRVCRDAWKAWRGHEMGTEGDSFFVVFDNAAHAAAAAVTAQRALAQATWPGGASVKVRMGVHTGVPTRMDEGYIGIDVHRAARIASTAHGGQIVISETTCTHLLSGTGTAPAEIRDDVAVQDLGRHRLKDLPDLEHLFQLTLTDLPAEFPPLKTLGSATRLPAFAAPLVGRDREVTELASLLSDPAVRLITLTGPGGTGKTRLAVATAARMSEQRKKEVHFVDCSEAFDADGAWASIGAALELPASDRSGPAVISHLATKRLTLLLDNLEQVDGADAVVTGLMTDAADVRVLATSRSLLHVPGECEFAVPQLATTAEDGKSPAVQLFEQYASMAKRGFEVTESNLADVAAVCERLDGLPLAIELAAARSRLLTPSALLVRLDKALDIGTAAARPGRQQTLRQAIAWSYDLLRPDQQRAFAALAVLAPGANLEECAAVLDGDLDAFDVVADLADLSLIVVSEDDDGEPAVGMLATLRAFAAERLAENGDEVRARDAHAAETARRVTARLREFIADRPGTPSRDFRLVDGVVAALNWLLREDNPGLQEQVDAVSDLFCMFMLRDWEVAMESGNHEQLVAWTSRVLDSGLDLDARQRLAVRIVASAGEFTCGRSDVAARHLDAAADDASEGGDALLFAYLGERVGVAVAAQQTDQAVGWGEDLAAVAERLGSLNARVYARTMLGFVHAMFGEEERALECEMQAAELYQQLGNVSRARQALANSACSLRLLGRRDQAFTTMRQLAPSFMDGVELVNQDTAFAEDYGALLAELNHPKLAALLLGTADALREKAHLPRHPSQVEEIAAPYDRAREALGDDYDNWHRRGAAMKLTAALRYVESELDDPAQGRM